MSIKIDNEFRTLIPPLTAEEFSQLEANCLENGIQDSLKTWNGILVDGHNRYEIAQKHGLEFRTEEMEFSSRDDVKLWIIKNQLGRRNLDKWQRFDLAKQQEHIEKVKAKERQGTRTDIQPILAESSKGQTRDKMASQVGVSHGTYDKMKAIDESDNEEVKQAVRKKEMSIDKAYREVKGLPPKKKSQPQTEVREAEITVTNEDVMKNPLQVEEMEVKTYTIPTPVLEEPLPFEEKIEFIETDESHEEVEDVAKDVAETAALAYVDDIMSGITKIVNTVKYNKANVVDEISQLDCEGFSKDELKASVDECMKVLAKLQNGLNGLTVRAN